MYEDTLAKRCLRNLPQLHRWIWYFAKCCVLFRNPLIVWHSYCTRASPPGTIVEFRNGMKILLSGHPHDIVSVFLTVIRQDYGHVKPNDIVVDIGANIGAFSLFAARSGAKRVLAYEACRETFEHLRRNISDNDMANVITPFQFAVTDTDGNVVRFPVRNSPYNSLAQGSLSAESEDVNTISLDTIIGDEPVIDILKMDCEGAEREILCLANPTLFRKIQRVVLEFHSDADKEIIPLLNQHGFRITRYHRSSSSCGNLWFDRE